MDSGIGGISVYRQIKKILPNFDYVYFADNEFFPYGNKTEEQIIERVIFNVRRLLETYDVKLFVIGCNTITAVVVDYLRATFPQIIFVGTEPAIKQAVEYSTSNILVIGTEATINNRRIRSRFSQGNLIWLPLTNLAKMIENGEKSGQIAEYVKSKTDKIMDNYDCVVLGCTHYVLIKDLLSSVFVGKKIFEGSMGVAQYVKTIVKKQLKLPEQQVSPCANIILTLPSETEYAKYLALIKE